jgi:membrane-bound metal-dependent hydrolase YbcI (DUF457 family)
VFIGHFALGFAAKRAVPRVSLATLFLAAQLADLLWPVLVALGVEQVAIEPGVTRVTPLNFISYPYSHSLATLALWGLGLAVLHRLGTNNRQAAPWLAVLVVSHWVLDYLTHRPDMPLYPGSPQRLGLGLWNSLPATLAVEIPLFAAGVWIYARATRPTDAIGRWAFPTLVAFLAIIYVGNLFGPPPSVRAIAIAGAIGGAVLLLWAAWVDRHRVATRS